MNGALQDAVSIEPPYDSSHIESFHAFHEIFTDRGDRTFKTFHDAYVFGKRVAYRLGFQIRIKTTGYNHKEGIIYKYVCCKRQGTPEVRKSTHRPDNTEKPHTQKPPPQSPLFISSKSARCGCQWNARLVGLRLPGTDAKVSLKQVQDTHEGFAWYWCPGERFFEHNHPLGQTELENFQLGLFSQPAHYPEKAPTVESASSLMDVMPHVCPPINTHAHVLEPVLSSYVICVHPNLHVDMGWRHARYAYSYTSESTPSHLQHNIK